MSWNPRYVAYAKTLGIPVDDVWEHDGRSNCGYICWINEQAGLFGVANPELFSSGKILDHKAFDRFLGAE